VLSTSTAPTAANNPLKVAPAAPPKPLSTAEVRAAMLMLANNDAFLELVVKALREQQSS
jgi:hypothetical protein